MDSPSSSSGAAAREFYLPATYGFSSAPGRLERFLTRHLRSREPEIRTGGETRGEFSVPATLGEGRPLTR